jgi:transposase
VLGLLLTPETPEAPEVPSDARGAVPPLAIGGDEEPKAPPPAKRRATGRRAITSLLPRVEIEVLPPEVQREGLDAFERIGEEVSEVVEHRPASLVVVRIVRPKFVRKRVAQGRCGRDPRPRRRC